jgi:putative sterol carrier protein
MDEEIKQGLIDKINEGSLNYSDLEAFLDLFCEVCNENEDAAYELEGWDRIFQFTIEGEDPFYMQSAEGKLTWSKTSPGEWDIELIMAPETITGIFAGEIDPTSAYMNNDLKVNGQLPDAVKFRTLTELVREEIED